MEKETKKIIILASVGIMTLAGIIGVSAVPIEDGLSYVDGDRKKEDDLGANYFPLIKSTVFDDSFSDKTFYVQQNGDVRVLSLNKQINGYENIGVYSSKSSADKVFYVATSDKDGVYHFEAVSYDELENVYGYDNMIFVIDEYAPNFILEESFIPDESIVQGYSKKEKYKKLKDIFNKENFIMNENNKGIIISKPEELYMEIDKGYMYRDKDTGKKVKMIFKYDTNIQTTLKKNNSTFTLKKHK